MEQLTLLKTKAMKNFKNILIGIALTAFSASALNAVTPLPLNTAAILNVKGVLMEAGTITAYLEGEGFAVLTTPKDENDGTWTCFASMAGVNYFVTVTVDCRDNIVGHDDVIID
jgi:hypothetical protein